jgi:hypothetical protein
MQVLLALLVVGLILLLEGTLPLLEVQKQHILGINPTHFFLVEHLPLQNLVLLMLWLLLVEEVVEQDGIVPVPVPEEWL